MAYRQLAGGDGHRWDIEDEGPLPSSQGTDGDDAEHRLRFTRDDGTERIRTSPRGLDRLRDAELRALLEGGDIEDAAPGPDTDANRNPDYGDARD